MRRRRSLGRQSDEVQLCAQAMALEEMLNQDVPAGAVFHVKSMRRRDVRFDGALRQLTIDVARRVHELIDSRLAPPPVVHPKCRQCSVQSVCMPEMIARPAMDGWAAGQLFTHPVGEVFGG